MHASWFLLLTSAVLGQAGLQPREQLNYQGTLAASDADSQTATRKPFDLTCWIKPLEAGGCDVYWLLDERGRGEWPWPQRFGVCHVNATGQTTGDSPALLYDRPERPGPAGKTPAGRDAVPLLLPIHLTEQPLAAEVEWQSDRFRFQVEKKDQRGERGVWQVALSDNLGRKGTAWIDQNSPVLVALNQRLILGRGDEYVLKLELVGSEVLDPQSFARQMTAFDAALALRGKLTLPRGQQEVNWKPDELAVLEQMLPEVQRAAAGSALAKLFESAGRDLELQSGRSDAIADLAAKQKGKQPETFSIRGFGDESLKDGDLKGNVTVLHFWEYRDEPLKEPYGQVGYLDFLNHRRKAGGVRVYGVAVDGRLADEATRPAAERSVRKLKEFMNLSFPVLLDGGSLLKKFGDPRVLGATLPLFVVIDRDGKIAHYHVGLYDVHQDQGLKELDEAVLDAAGKK
jgi:peroxiredoxin